MRILMVLIPDVEQKSDTALRLERFLGPYYVFVDAGVDVVLASPQGGAPWLPGKAGVTAVVRRFEQDMAAHEAVQDTLSLEQVHVDDFSGAFCIGVPGAIWDDEGHEPGAAMIARFLDRGRPVGVIPSQVDTRPHGSRHGLLIVGEAEHSPVQAARALLGAIADHID